MAMQLPPAFNALSLPAVDQAVQQNEFNALRNDALKQRSDRVQTEWNDSRKKQAQQMLYQMASKSKQVLQENPNAWAQLLPEWQKNLGDMGLPTDRIPPAGAAPESVMEGLDNILMSADMAGGAPEQKPLTKNDLIPIQGEGGSVYARPEDALGQGVPQKADGGLSGRAASFRDIVNGAQLSPEEENAAFRVELGLAPKAGTVSANERIAGDSGLTESVADSQAVIAERRKFGELTGTQRAKTIDSAFENIEAIKLNNMNLDKAIQAIDDGASTGAIESQFFPTFREATVKLENVQKQLGLDVIGSVTFGALSKGELDLALSKALPTGLQPDALRQWIVDKKTAQDKLTAYYQEQIDFLDEGGTLAGFSRKKRREAEKPTDDFQSKWDAAASGTILQAPDGTMRKKP